MLRAAEAASISGCRHTLKLNGRRVAAGRQLDLSVWATAKSPTVYWQTQANLMPCTTLFSYRFVRPYSAVSKLTRWGPA